MMRWLGVFIVALLSLEAMVRLHDGIPLFSLASTDARHDLLRTNARVRYDPVLGWVNKENDPYIHTDFMGFRGKHEPITFYPDDSLNKSLNPILAVGDSFTYGSEVDDDQNWPSYLEAMIGKMVLASGTGGWGSDQIIMQAEQLKERIGDGYAPSLLLLEIEPSADIDRAGYSVVGGGAKPWYSIEQIPISPNGTEKVPGNLVLHNVPVVRFGGEGWKSSVLDIAARSALVTRIGRSFDPNWRHFEAYQKTGQDGMDITCMLLKRLRSEYKHVGLVLQWGGAETLPGMSEHVYGGITAACAKDYDFVVDTFDTIQQSPVHELLYNRHGEDYGHMTPAGNALVANEIAKAMK